MSVEAAPPAATDEPHGGSRGSGTRSRRLRRSVAAPASRPARSAWRSARREWSAYVFLAPGLIVFSIFTLFALLFAFYLTFHEWDIINPDKPFVGLQNYSRMMTDTDFQQSIINTFYFTGASVPLSMIIGLLIALLLNQGIRMRGLFRTMFFLPQVTPFIVVAIVWKWLYNGDYGLFNYYLLKTHLITQPLHWLSDQNLAMPAVVLMTVWAGIGFSMVVYLAALQAVPEELYEAAKMDGAGGIARFWNITVPQLRPTTLFLLVIGIIGSLQVFTQIYVMTNGGPVDKTTTMVFFIYQAAFKFYQMGYASTLSFVLFAMTLVFTAIQLWLYKKADQ
jgi:multiple sugar transport system permease protein